MSSPYKQIVGNMIIQHVVLKHQFDEDKLKDVLISSTSSAKNSLVK